MNWIEWLDTAIAGSATACAVWAWRHRQPDDVAGFNPGVYLMQSGAGSQDDVNDPFMFVLSWVQSARYMNDSKFQTLVDKTSLLISGAENRRVIVTTPTGKVLKTITPVAPKGATS